MDSISVKQKRILEFISEFMIENPFPPTIRDIARNCDISSTSVVDYNLRKLEREGYISRTADVSRGISLINNPDKPIEIPQVIKVPIVGNIAAGEPLNIETQTSYSDFLEDNNEVTLKHFYLQNGIVTLKPANPTMTPITVAAEKVAVRGKVVGVIRSMSNNLKSTVY